VDTDLVVDAAEEAARREAAVERVVATRSRGSLINFESDIFVL
jgi:hypothetical protein